MTDQAPSLLWRIFFVLGYRHGLLRLALAAAVLVGAYRLFTGRPLFDGLFNFLLGIAVGALLLTLVVAGGSQRKSG